MSTEIIKINTDKLSNDSDEIKKGIKDIDTQINYLKKNITDLNKMWEGNAYNAFKTAIDDDLTALQTIVDNLDKIYQYEQTAKADYDNCEKQVAQLIDSITIKEV